MSNPGSPQGQAVSVGQALHHAARLHGAGQLQEAEYILNQILQVHPKNPHALHLLGLVASSVGKLDLAIELIGQAIGHDGGIAPFHANLGEICRMAGKTDKAIEHGKIAVGLDPALVFAWSNLGIAYFDAGDFTSAIECHQKALALQPDYAQSLNNLGSVARKEKEFERAAEYYRHAGKVASAGYVEPMNNLGATLVHMGRHEEALAVLNRVIEKNAVYAEAICNRGFASLGLDRYKDAIEDFVSALRLRPNYPEAFHGMAKVYSENRKYHEAESALAQAIALEPEQAEHYSTLAAVYMKQDKEEQAMEMFQKALSLESNLASAHMGLGNMLVERGDFKGAEECFRHVLEQEPQERLAALFGIVQARKVKTGEDIVALLQAEEAVLDGLAPDNKIYAHFALGKMYDDFGEAGRSFPHFLQACSLYRQKIEYDAGTTDALCRSLKEIFTEDCIARYRGAGHGSEMPIFVLGMPRSGTTLTEQIIASHSQVFGAGELHEWMDLTNWYGLSDASSPFPETLRSMDREQLQQYGEAYVARLQKRSGKRYITDKMPANFWYIGLIHLALPNAKIVHVQRHPLDTCVSCFTRFFVKGSQPQTYDLYELGRYYRAYAEIMEYWRAVLPEGAFYDIRYEDLIGNTEDEARKLLAYCGLEWEDSCLEFYKSERRVRTASVTQVRQPIYTTSVARWKKYEPFLQPLIEGLGDAWDGR